MSSRDEPRLPEAAEAMLRDWPAPERDDGHWEQAAAAVVARLEQGETEPTSDELLAPPLPPEQDEGVIEDEAASADASATPARRPPPRDDSKPGLADLARSRVKGDDARREAAEIAKASLSLLKEEKHTGATADTVAAAASNKADGDVASLDAARARREAAAAQAQRTTEDSRTGKMAAVALVVVGLAAGVAVYVTGRVEPPTTTTTTVAAPAASTVPGLPEGELKERAKRAAGKADDEAVALGEPAPATAEDLPTEDVSPQRVARASKRDDGTVEAEDVDLEGAGDESAQPRMAEPDEEDEDLQPALGEPMVREPTSGAISSALGPALGAARRCVAGHDRPSTATVVFSSNGSVKSVTVSGPAAGTGAGTCIKKALGGMRLQRFGRPTYTVRGIAIRP